jgi:hypothetical protein
VCLRRLLCFICIYYASCGTADELVLRPYHGIAFGNVGLLDSDMIIWHQISITTITQVAIPSMRSAMWKLSPQKNDVSELNRITGPFLGDWSK